MIHAVVDRNIAELVGIHAFQAADIVSVLVGIGPALVVRVDATDRAEKVLGSVRVELVQPQRILALDDMDTGERHRRNDGAFAPADRTVAAARVDDPVWKVEFKYHRATMARRSMLWPNLGTADVFYHD